MITKFSDVKVGEEMSLVLFISIKMVRKLPAYITTILIKRA